jgi:undecaprenyl phosphate-alpha-L-ara4N flippase subunit ArnF
MKSRALLLAGCSVALVTLAQVGMRWSLMRLPHLESLPVARVADIGFAPASLLVAAIVAYGASLLCWLAALRHLPLNRAYPLLSVSYALVYLASALLPGLEGSFSLRKSIGVALVLLGVTLIHARAPASPASGHAPR